MPFAKPIAVLHGWTPIFFAFFLVVGGLLRLWSLNERSLWHDEGYTMAFVRSPAGEMNRFLAADDHPPLYYWALRGWLGDGGGVTRGRLFSVLCSLAALPLAFWLGCRLGGRGAGLGAMALMAFSPQAIYYAQELRMYALQSLWAAALMIAGHAALRRPSWPRIALAVMFGGLACYTHYFSALFVIGWISALALARREDEPRGGPAVVRAAGATLALALLYWPWLGNAMAHTLLNAFGGMKAAENVGGATAPTAEFLNRIFETALGLARAFPFDAALAPDSLALITLRFWLTFAYCALLFCVFALGLYRLRAAGRARLFFLAFLIVPWLLATAYQAAGGRFYPRFVLPLLPLGFAAIAGGVGGIRPLWGKTILWILLIAPMWSSAAAQLRTDWRDVSRDAAERLLGAIDGLAGEPAGAALILHADTHSFWTLRGYDSWTDRHRLLAGPHVPAIARLMWGEEAVFTVRDRERERFCWVVYGEWRGAAPTAPGYFTQRRFEDEPRWFGQGWRLAGPPMIFRRGIKKMEIVAYERVEQVGFH